jgi:hypothetical protein
LNEGFATFMAAAYDEERFGRAAYLRDIERARLRYEAVREADGDRSLVFPEWNHPTANDRTIVYQKGAYVLRLLREHIGDDMFWAGIRQYTAAHAGGSVTTDHSAPTPCRGEVSVVHGRDGLMAVKRPKAGAKMETALSLLVTLSALAVPAAAANLTGQWSLALAPDLSGHNDTLACSFVHDSEKLTISCGAGPNILGEVHGQQVTFRVITGRSNELTAVFVGSLDQLEATISGTWQLPDNSGKREGRFTAAKVSNAKQSARHEQSLVLAT